MESYFGLTLKLILNGNEALVGIIEAIDPNTKAITLSSGILPFN